MFPVMCNNEMYMEYFMLGRLSIWFCCPYAACYRIIVTVQPTSIPAALWVPLGCWGKA